MTELRNLTIASPIDDMSGAVMGITFGHHEVHEGDSYVCSAVDAAMGNTDTLTLCFKTMAAAKRVHLIAHFATLGVGHLDIVEGPTWDDTTGTLASIHNRNRSSANTSDLEEDQSTGAFIVNNNLNANPTNLAGGTIVDSLYTFAAIRTEGGARDSEERILAAATQYAVRYTADAANNAGFIHLVWYEHTDTA